MSKILVSGTDQAQINEGTGKRAGFVKTAIGPVGSEIYLPASVLADDAGTTIDVSTVDPVSTSRGLLTTTLPFDVLGLYEVEGNISYTTTTINQPLFSFRWSDATKLAVILRVDVSVILTVAGTAGLIERQLIAARSFTASDTGGTALTPTLNNGKRRTGFATSVVADVRVGILTAGTRTLDANPFNGIPAWIPAAAGGAIPKTDLLNATNGAEYPLILAQNEGFIVRFGAAEPASTRQSFFHVLWAEVNP